MSTNRHLIDMHRFEQRSHGETPRRELAFYYEQSKELPRNSKHEMNIEVDGNGQPQS